MFATADRTTGLMSVPAGGGDPKVLTKPDAGQRESDHLFPFVLPGGRGVLFTITSTGQGDNSQVAVLDSKTGQRRTLVRGGSHAEYVESGHLVYAAAGTLRAVRFDLARLEVTSDPFPVVEHVMTFANGAANYSISRQGTLVYVPGGAGSAVPRSLVWVNRSGREEPLRAPVRTYVVPRLSPDGTQIALQIFDQESDIWVWHIAHQTLTRLTFDPGLNQSPVWTRDGKRIIFASQRAGGTLNLYWRTADGTGSDERLTTGANAQIATSITPDGSRVIGFEVFPQTAHDIVSWLLATPGGRTPRETERLVQTTFMELQPDVSPDGRYIAYQSNESGQFEIYVRPFPKVDAGRWQVSTGGGSQPAWARNGRELFYLDASSALTSVAVQTTGPTFNSGNPTKVFATRYAAPVVARSYDVSPDGQRFLMIKDNTTTDDKSTPASLVVVERWFEELKARVR